jgi:hypothetical protein
MPAKMSPLNAGTNSLPRRIHPRRSSRTPRFRRGRQFAPAPSHRRDGQKLMPKTAPLGCRITIRQCTPAPLSFIISPRRKIPSSPATKARCQSETRNVEIKTKLLENQEDGTRNTKKTKTTRNFQEEPVEQGHHSLKNFLILKVKCVISTSSVLYSGQLNNC